MNERNPADIALKEQGILNKHVLAALSGGADSVALVLLLNDLKKQSKIALTCAHFEHGIRGGDSKADLEFVKFLCMRLEIDLIYESGNVPEEACKSKESIETCARRMRHAFLKKVKAQVNADVIATAHHKDDQAETVLMHLLRGGGLSGARGMQAEEGEYIRPLLHFSKKELVQYLERKGEVWREDKTNFISDNKRNLLRLEAMPVLERAYPGCADALLRFSEIARAEDEYMAAVTTDAYSKYVSCLSGVRMIRNPGQMPVAVLRRVIRKIENGFDFTEIERIRTAESKIMLSNGYTCEKIDGTIYLVKNECPPSPVQLNMNGDTVLSGICTLSAHPSDGAYSKSDVLSQTLDKNALEGACVRTRRDTDFMRPLGMSGKKKLISDILTDRKVPRPLRDRLPVIAKGNEVLWLVGHMISESAKITSSSAPIRINANFDTKDGGKDL